MIHKLRPKLASLPRASIAAGIASLLALYFLFEPSVGLLARRVETSILGKGAVDKQLKVLSIDDEAASGLGTDSPSIESWAAVINAVAKRRPEAIVLVDVVDWRKSREYGEWLDDFLIGLKAQYGFRIFTTATVIENGQVQPGGELLRAFDGIGHISNDRYGQPIGSRHGLAHLAAVSRNRESAALPARLTFDQGELEDRSLSVFDAFEANRTGRFVDGLEPGDTVAILGRPIYLGSTDLDQTLFLDSLNAGLVGEEGKALPLSTASVFAWIVLAAGLAWRRDRRESPWVVSLVAPGAAATGIAMAALGLLAPWMHWTAGAGAVAIFACADWAFARYEVRSLRRRTVLHGVPVSMAPLLSKLFDEDGQRFDGSGIVVSVAFEGFSLVANRDQVGSGFGSIDGLYRQVRETILGCGGVLSSEGDQMIAVFGVLDAAPADRSFSDSAASQALSAAFRIQNVVQAHNQRAEQVGELVCPTKIGVAAGKVTFGAVDLSLVVAGEGVRESQKLLNHCRGQHVVVASDVYQAGADGGGVPSGFIEKLVFDSLQDRYVAVFDFDLCLVDGDSYARTERAFQRAAGIERRANRLQIAPSVRISVDTGVSSGEVVDFSDTGLAISLGRCLAPGQLVDLRISASEERIALLLQTFGLCELVGEVRWGRPKGNQFIHGISLANLTRTQQRHLVEALSLPLAEVSAA